MRENILITGGTGFIGFHLIKKLKKKFNIISLSSKKPKINRDVKGVKYIQCDVFKKKLLCKKLNKIKIKYIINLAGYIDHSNKKKTYQSHYHGCKNLIDYFSDKNIKLFLQIGSSLEYGKQKPPHHERMNCYPTATYGKSKLKSTNYIIHSSKKYNFPYVILRLYQIYGPNQSVNRLIPIVIKSCLQNKKFKCSSGIQIRDFLYVDDLVNLINKIIFSSKKLSGIFNVGSRNPVQVKNVIKLIRKKINKGHPQFGKISMRKDEMKKYFPNLDKISKYVSWRPETPLNKGLDKTIKFYKMK